MEPPALAFNSPYFQEQNSPEANASGLTVFSGDGESVTNNSSSVEQEFSRPRLAASSTDSATLRLSIPPRDVRRHIAHLHKQKTPADAGRFFVFVDTLSENWNQLESYVFEAYELIKSANLGSSSKELAAA